MKKIIVLLLALMFISLNVSAAYVRANKESVEIDAIYSNEWGSPFVTFKTQINSVCSEGVGP